MADKHGFRLQVPTSELSSQQLELIMYGTGKETYKISLGMGRNFETTYEGVVPNLERRHRETDSDFIRRDIERFMQEKPCHACNGLRLKPEVLAITVAKKSIMDICQLSIDEALTWFKNLKLNEVELKIANLILKEISARLQFLQIILLDLGFLLLTSISNSQMQRRRIILGMMDWGMPLI